MLQDTIHFKTKFINLCPTKKGKHWQDAFDFTDSFKYTADKAQTEKQHFILT